MSFTFVAALTGEESGKVPFPQGRQTSSLHSLLGQGAYLFRFLVDGEEITTDQIWKGDVTVFFLKEPVAFNLYFHEEISHRMWLVDTFPVDVLSHLGVLNPLGVLNNVDKYGRLNVGLPAWTLWTAFLKPQLEHRGLERRGEGNMFKKLVMLIEHDIMKVRRATRRNVLHEMANTLRVDIFLNIDAENYLNLRLQAPTGNVISPTLAPCGELHQLISSTPLP